MNGAFRSVVRVGASVRESDARGEGPGRVGRMLIGLLAVVIAAVTPARLPAQLPDVGGSRPEARVDLRPLNAVELGGGVSVPTSFYVRLGALAGAGALRDGDTTRATGRIELHLRLPLDPLMERRWAPYLIGGGALACTAERRCQPLLVLRVGLEGPRSVGGWTPAVEAGVGGGLRVALVLRRATPGAR